MSGERTGIRDVGLDDQQIEVTVRPQLPARGGAKKYDLLRLRHLDDPADNLPQNCNIVVDVLTTLAI